MKSLEHFARRLQGVGDAELIGSFAFIHVTGPRGMERLAHLMTRILQAIVRREIERRGIDLRHAA